LAERPIVLGLTGSIAMGKSETAKMFACLGVPTFNADSAVHALYAQPDVVAAIAERFPAATQNGRVDRLELAAALHGEPAAFAALEAIVHPRVFAAQEQFLADAGRTGARFAVLDIPLLFETGWDKYCDAVAVVSAPPEVQRARVLARAGMTDEKFRVILGRQMPDEEKRRRADFVIDTGQGFAYASAQVARIAAILSARK
jgi:dephospho-CoA kinase